MYVGSQTGDIIEVQIQGGLMKRIAPCGKLFTQGITQLKIYDNNDLLVGSGKGNLVRIDINSLKRKN